MKTHSNSLPNSITIFTVVLFSIVVVFSASGCSSKPGESEQQIRRVQTSKDAININRADIKEFLQLPSIGPVLAKNIVDHRSKHGAFRRPELLLLVDGISDKRYRAVRKYIKTD